MSARVVKDLVEAGGAPQWGPKMTALANDKQRAFVCALFDAPKKKGALMWAARVAGYGSETSSPKSISVISSRLAHDERVQAAIAEESQRRLRAMPPEAIAALENLIHDASHPSHMRAIAAVLDRSDPVELTHKVKIEDHRQPPAEATQAVLARIEELMQSVGLKKPAPIIDGDYKVVDGGAA